MFTEYLRKIVDNVEGGMGGLIMGLDGIAVETYLRDGHRFDINTIGMEFSYILTQVKKAGDSLQIGGITEFAIKAEQLLMVIRMLTDEYFLAVVLSADGNFGKARFMMRVTEPKLRAAL